MPLFPIPLIHATVAPLLMPDCPTRMSISATMWLSSSLSQTTCYLQDRDEIADDVIIAISPGTPKRLCESLPNVGAVQSDINPRVTVESIKVLFRGIKASSQPHFALSHAPGFNISHYHECYIVPMQGNLPAFQLNATVRAAFIPDSALEFFSIFSSLKYAKSSIFSGFLHS